jgi:hypothetical protein
MGIGWQDATIGACRMSIRQRAAQWDSISIAASLRSRRSAVGTGQAERPDRPHSRGPWAPVPRRLGNQPLRDAVGAQPCTGNRRAAEQGTPGVLDDTSVLSTYEVLVTGASGRFAVGGMALKLVAAREALASGLASVRIAYGRVHNPVSRALAECGTMVTTTCAESATNSLRERANRI